MGGSKDWKKDVTGAMILPQREIPRLLARATFLAKTLRFLSMTYPTCLCSCPFVPLSSPALVRAAPGPLSSRLLRCVPSRYSFVLPRLPSLVVLADATGDSTPRRDVTRTMISGKIFSPGSSIDPPTVFAILFCTFPLQKRLRKISNESRSIDYTLNRTV